MQIGFGKHKGKTIALVVLKEPDYIKWLLEQSEVTGNLAQVRTEVGRLLSVFDTKPIKSKCSGRNCGNPAVKFTAYAGNPSSLYPWCDTCDPYQTGAVRSRISEIRTYREALNHVEVRCSGQKKGYREIIRGIASDKGLPARCGEAQAEAFFEMIG